MPALQRLEQMSENDLLAELDDLAKRSPALLFLLASQSEAIRQRIPEPTMAEPGTRRKEAVISQRLAARPRQMLFHPEDIR